MVATRTVGLLMLASGRFRAVLRPGKWFRLFLGAGFLAASCGGDGAATTGPAPANIPALSPATPPPAPPATPAGLTVSERGSAFIEWSWEAVRGADGYDVQTSVDAVFDESDGMPWTVEATTWRQTELAPASTLHLRVRARAGTLSSEWSSGVEGQSLESVSDRIAAALEAVGSGGFSNLGRSIWIGAADPRFGGGSPFYAESERVARPAASAIKSAYLVEFFSDRAGALDEPVPGAGEILATTSHPAIVMWDPETQAEIRDRLETADARTVGQRMVRGTGVSISVHNAAANLVAAFLGGPRELTRRIQARHPEFAGIHSRRYMAAARDVTGDNEATAASLAAVLAAIARGRVPRMSGDTHDEIRDALFLDEDGANNRHYYKGGSLYSNPVTHVQSGYWEDPSAPEGAQLVYVFMAEHPGRGRALYERVRDHMYALRRAAVPIAWRHLGGVGEPAS